MVRLLFQIELNRFETNAKVTQKFSFVVRELLEKYSRQRRNETKSWRRLSDPEKELENDCSLPAGINSQTCLHRDMTSLEKRSVREENHSNIESEGITPTKDLSRENEENLTMRGEIC